MIQKELALNAEEYVRKALLDCADDEIALDGLAQWASNPVGKKGGYGIEETYPIIRENLSSRFNVSDAIASEYVERLRECGTQFMLCGADIEFVRANILEQLKAESGNKWRQGILRRLSRSSLDARRLCYLIFYLTSRGYEVKTFEASLDEIQAFYSATFGSWFKVLNMQEALMDIGILNRLMYTAEDSSTRQYVHTINSMFSLETLGLKVEELKIPTETKGLISHMFDKKMFDQLRFLDELGREHFGKKRFENGLGNFVPDKRACGHSENYAVISPFFLEEIRNDIHSRKQRRLDEYESRIENSLFTTINESWTHCKMDYLKLKGEQSLWSLDNGADTKLFVNLALWTTESDLEMLSSKLKVPKASSLIAIVLNEPLDSARERLKDKLSNCDELALICTLNQKEAKAETLVGSPTPFSSAIIEALTRALNLSSPTKNGSKHKPKEINQDAQVGWEEDRPKILIGTQDTREIYWAPMKEQNSNIAILGDTDSGKTQAIKKILLEIRKESIPFLVVDSAGDLSKDSSNKEFGTVLSASQIAVNPLEPDKCNSPRERKYQLLEILDAVYGLKDWEVEYLQSGIERSYESKGIVEDNPPTWENVPPTLADLHRALDLIAGERKGNAKGSIKEIFQKIGTALEHPLFSLPKTNIPFEKLVTGSIIIELSGLQSDSLKTLATEFLLGKIPSLAESQYGDLRLFVAIDGLQKIFGRNSASLGLLREARHRGIGLIYSCQNPANLSEIVFNNTGTILSFCLSDSKNAKIVAEHMGIADQVLHKNMSDKFSAVVKLSSQADVSKLALIPYFKKDQINE